MVWQSRWGFYCKCGFLNWIVMSTDWNSLSEKVVWQSRWGFYYKWTDATCWRGSFPISSWFCYATLDSGRPKSSVRFGTSAGTLFRVVSVLRRESHFGKTYRTELKHYKNDIFFKKLKKMAEIFEVKWKFSRKKLYFSSVCLCWRFSERFLRLNEKYM